MSPTPSHTAAQEAPLRSLAWPLVVLAVLLAGLGVICISLLSAARAYVGGESQWSRAQKTAAHHLLRHADTRAPQDWQTYLQAIAVPLGDRRAREELDKPDPDLAVVHAGFVAGLNHPDDVPGLIRLYRVFRHVPFMAQAIAIWTEGDVEVARLTGTALALHEAVLAGADERTLAALKEQVHTIDARLTPLEARFSATLGEAARLTHHLLVATVVLAAATLSGLTWVAMRRAARHDQAQAQALQDSQARFHRAILDTNNQLEQRVQARTQELQLANERLLELDRLKSQFLASMSHELRTPLNSILGFTGLLRQGLPGPLNEEQQRQLSFVHGSAQHLLTLINDLLDLSRIESGRMEVAHEPFDFAELAAEAAAQLRPLAASKSLALQLQVPPALPMVGDRRKVYQVLLNLTNNALKFTPEGGVVVNACALDGCLRVQVVDTGIGIAPEAMGTLFEAFRQIDGTLVRAHEGTGLGLHLCRKLLGLMGGEIDVRSHHGAGSIFSFALPLNQPQVQA